MARDDDVIEIIDVETYVPKSLKRKHRRSRKTTNSWKTTTIVFCLDDDDEVAALSSRKTKTAEQIRQEEMERRQKRRVEELRETRKREEEDMKKKQEIRDSVERELQRLERRCHDMGSLLQELGILGPKLRPTPGEVSLAYRKALLRFHPDRVSGSDMRHKVEAEEKFKLLLRIKDRLVRHFRLSEI